MNTRKGLICQQTLDADKSPVIMGKMIRSRKMDSVFVMMIFCLFAVSMLMVLMFGASVYKNITAISRENQDSYTCLSYIWSKVKNNDIAGSVYIGEFDGLPALCLEEEYDSVKYQTRIYLYDGWVRELFNKADFEFSPEAGVPVFEVQSLAFDELEPGLIRVSVDSRSLLIYPRAAA